MSTEKFVQYDQSHFVSSNGNVISSNGYLLKPYISTNNISYQMFDFDDGTRCLKRLDIIIAYIFIPIPDELIELPLTIHYLDGDVSNVCVSNLEWVEDVEEWRYIISDEISSVGYKVSSWGRIMSPSGEILKGTNRNGYVAITLRTNNGCRKMFMIHRLVAQTFIGSVHGMDVNHIDGNRKNNRLDNIEIVTRWGNNNHAIVSGLRHIKLTNEIAGHINELLISFNGSPSKVLMRLKDEGYNEITDDMIYICKRNMIKSGMKFDVKFEKKFTEESRSLVEKLLMDFDGNIHVVYNKIHDEFVDITIENIKSVKSQMARNGYVFTNMKHNRKINETERTAIIDILKKNNNSPSRAMKQISNDPNLIHVTVYDVKYIKRKYINDEV